MIHPPRGLLSRERLREVVEADVARFREMGGKIDKYPAGHTSERRRQGKGEKWSDHPFKSSQGE